MFDKVDRVSGRNKIEIGNTTWESFSSMAKRITRKTTEKKEKVEEDDPMEPLQTVKGEAKEEEDEDEEGEEEEGVEKLNPEEADIRDMRHKLENPGLVFQFNMSSFSNFDRRLLYVMGCLMDLQWFTCHMPVLSISGRLCQHLPGILR